MLVHGKTTSSSLSRGGGGLCFEMWLVVLVGFLAIVTSVHFYFERKRKYRDIEKLPRPPTKFLFGNALEFGGDTVETFRYSQRIIRDYGPLVPIWFGPFRLHLFITDVRHVEYFLTSNVHITKSIGYSLYRIWLGKGLPFTTGDQWKKQRKMITPAFHFRNIENFSETFNRLGNVLVENLKERVGTDVNVYSFICLYAFDAICESSFKTEVTAQKESDNAYINAMNAILEVIVHRFYSVFNWCDFFFQFTSDYQRMIENIIVIKAYTRNIVEQRKKVLEHEGVECARKEGRKAFLDLLLDNAELTIDEIAEQVDTFMLAGQDTLSTAISFCLFEIAKHPDVQKHILDELEEVVGKNKAAVITVKHLQDMCYLDRVVKEVLRLYPPLPLFERELTVDLILNSIRIPKGTTISFHPYAQHHNEELFPDPEKFDPDRFLPENVSTRNPFAYIPFSAGPRNCIGQKYAMVNSKTTVANMVRHFELHPVVPEHKPLLASDAVLKSANGLPIKLKLRE